MRLMILLFKTWNIALQILPTRSQWGSGSYYKASKGAAQALLGDVYLTRGCMDNNNTVCFQEAKKTIGGCD